jgi:phosphoribosylpyrophosphate synthetase
MSFTGTQGRTVVLVDDMADTCYTLLNAVNQLIRDRQIKRIFVPL